MAKKIQPITAAGANNGTASTTTIHTDFLGSPVAETNATGTVTRVERYTPYGEPSDMQLDAGPGFTGHATDVATGLTNMQQRYMDAELGRFLTPDPVGPEEDFINHFNRYNYAQNNPVRYTDPDGRAVDTIVDAGFAVYDTGKLLGATAAFVVGKFTGNNALANEGLQGMKQTGTDLGKDVLAAVVPGLSAPMVKTMGNAADIAVAERRASSAVETTTKGAGQREISTNVTQAEMKSNLADAGYKKIPSNPKVETMSNGKTSYNFRSDKPTVDVKGSVNGTGPTTTKIRTGVEDIKK